jgi:hypothetical protein
MDEKELNNDDNKELEHICYRLKCIREGMRVTRKNKLKGSKIKETHICGVPRIYIVKGLKWINRGASMVGGSLILIGANEDNKLFNQIGGIIAITTPIFESFLSKREDELEKIEEEQINLKESLDYFNNECKELGEEIKNIEKNSGSDFLRNLSKFKELKVSLQEFKENYGQLDADNKDREKWEKFTKFREIKVVEEQIWILVNFMKEKFREDHKQLPV